MLNSIKIMTPIQVAEMLGLTLGAADALLQIVTKGAMLLRADVVQRDGNEVGQLVSKGLVSVLQVQPKNRRSIPTVRVMPADLSLFA